MCIRDSLKSVNNHLSSLRAYNEFLIDSGVQTELTILKNDFMKVQLQYANPCTVEKKDVEAFRQRLLESGNKRDFAIITLYTYKMCIRYRLRDGYQSSITTKEIVCCYSL